KTGMYYLRTKAAAEAIKFTVEKETTAKPAVSQQKSSETISAPGLGAATATQESPAANTESGDLSVPDSLANATKSYDEGMTEIACSLDNPEACVACGS